MNTTTMFLASLLASLVLNPVRPAGMTVSHAPLPFETVEREETSGFGTFHPGFAGVDLLIRDDTTWEWFWAQHKSNIVSPPPLPVIDFGREMVIVTVLGFQTTGGGPNTRVLEANTDDGCGCLHVLIQDDETPGPTDNITNPYHIIKLEKLKVRSVVFEHRGS